MIALDTNILIYADREDSALHAAALRAVRLLAEGDEAWAIPVFCVGEFLRVVSHDRLFDRRRRSWTPSIPWIHCSQVRPQDS